MTLAHYNSVTPPKVIPGRCTITNGTAEPNFVKGNGAWFWIDNTCEEKVTVRLTEVTKTGSRADFTAIVDGTGTHIWGHYIFYTRTGNFYFLV